MSDETFQPLDEFSEHRAAFPQPPRLHWAWVLLLSLITGYLFYAAWLLVQARWIRRVEGTSNAYGWAIVYLLVTVFELLGDVTGHGSDYVHGAVLILYLVTAFLLRGDLEDSDIGLPLSKTMTFFFGAIYFQYFLREV